MNYKLEILDPDNAAEPVTFAEMRAQSNLLDPSEKPFIDALIVAGRQYVEGRCRIVLRPTSYRISYDRFAPCIELPPEVRPLINVSTVNYVPINGDEIETESMDSSSWYLDDKGISATIRFREFAPVANVPNAVQVFANAGYEAGSCPELLKLAIKSWVAAAYENREAYAQGQRVTLPHAFDAILSMFSKPEV